jgi:hypothetical protein
MGRPLALAKGHRRALDRLKAVPGLRGFYLAGGSALTAHLGHRRSADLDLFSTSSVRYPYAPLDRPKPGADGFPLASLRDLAVMKLAAIARRGLKRDFWDLHEILSTGMTLTAATTAYRRRFERSAADLYAVLRALTFFDDAEADPTFPRGLTRRHRAEIKRFFQVEAPRLLRRRPR